MNNIYKVLEEKFCYTELREFQKIAIIELLEGNNVIVLSPTGGGKSLCYQLPAIAVKNKITFVISPLISLIEDQVSFLKSRNIESLKISGTMEDKHKLNKKNIIKYSIVFITPESIRTNNIMNYLEWLNKNDRINFFAIDEAHCVSTWGHEFRPKYLELSFISKYKRPIMALTATANNIVKKDIQNLLKITNCKIIQLSCVRKNLKIKVFERDYRTIDKIVDLIRSKYNRVSGIIYCISRMQCENIANKLQENNINCSYYHAGMETAMRTIIQTKWIKNEIKLIIATIAFGMGINKEDVRYVIHLNMPKSIENYYQEIGRAGRDGLDSDCLIYYDVNDKDIYCKMMDSEKSEYNTHQYKKIYSMIDLLSNDVDCRQKLICNYFNENIDNCGGCDNCIKDCKKKKYNIGEMITCILNIVKNKQMDDAEIIKILKMKFTNTHRNIFIRSISYLLSNHFLIEVYEKSVFNIKLKISEKGVKYMNEPFNIYIDTIDKPNILNFFK